METLRYRKPTLILIRNSRFYSHFNILCLYSLLNMYSTINYTNKIASCLHHSPVHTSLSSHHNTYLIHSVNPVPISTDTQIHILQLPILQFQKISREPGQAPTTTQQCSALLKSAMIVYLKMLDVSMIK